MNKSKEVEEEFGEVVYIAEVVCMDCQWEGDECELEYSRRSISGKCPHCGKDYIMDKYTPGDY